MRFPLPPYPLIASILLLGIVCASGCATVRDWVTPSRPSSDEVARSCDRARITGDHSEATRLLHVAARSDPDNIEYYVELAHLARDRGELKNAELYYRALLLRSSGDSDAWRELGEIQVQMGEPEKAIESFEEALRNDPHDIAALLELARLQRSLDRMEEAVTTYHRLLMTDPEHTVATLALAELMLADGRADRAIPMLQALRIASASEADPRQRLRVEQRRREWLLGVAYGHERRWHDAAESLAAAVRQSEQPTIDELYRLAYAQWRSGRDVQARAIVEDILRRRPGHQAAEGLRLAIASDEELRTVSHDRQPMHTPSVIPPDGWKF